MVTQEQLAAQLAALRAELESQIEALRGQVQGLQTENQTLRTRVARLELKGLFVQLPLGMPALSLL
jgi:phage shock protein A